MKQLLLTTIAAVLLVGCGESQQSAPAPETQPAEPVAEAATPEPPTAKAPDISIHEAVSTGNIEAVKQHLAAGEDVNAKGKYGATPLHNTAIKEIAELLIPNGAEVNAKDGNGWTPLHYAAGRGHRETAELLIAKGADVNAKGADGKTPLDSADGELADLLRKHGGKTGEELALMPRLVQHGRFAFSFVAMEGKVYEVQDSFNLLNWEVIKTYNGTGASVRFDEERDHDPLQIFYRVKLVE